MLVRPREVAAVLTLVILLMAAKLVPFFAQLPLSNIIGIICAAFSIYLALGIFQDELKRVRAE